MQKRAVHTLLKYQQVTFYVHPVHADDKQTNQ